jgi:hypothetical protein
VGSLPEKSFVLPRTAYPPHFPGKHAFLGIEGAFIKIIIKRFFPGTFQFAILGMAQFETDLLPLKIQRHSNFHVKAGSVGRVCDRRPFMRNMCDDDHKRLPLSVVIVGS